MHSYVNHIVITRCRESTATPLETWSEMQGLVCNSLATGADESTRLLRLLRPFGSLHKVTPRHWLVLFQGRPRNSTDETVLVPTKQTTKMRRLCRTRGLCGTPRRRRQLLDLLELPTSTPHEHVKRSYLSAILQTHPDRNNDPLAHDKFTALNSAWADYQQKTEWRRTIRAESASGGFTGFGVGCSFADDAKERQQRKDLMDQASVGRINQRTLAATDETTRET